MISLTPEIYRIVSNFVHGDTVFLLRTVRLSWIWGLNIVNSCSWTPSFILYPLLFYIYIYIKGGVAPYKVLQRSLASLRPSSSATIRRLLPVQIPLSFLSNRTLLHRLSWEHWGFVLWWSGWGLSVRLLGGMLWILRCLMKFVSDMLSLGIRFWWVIRGRWFVRRHWTCSERGAMLIWCLMDGKRGKLY